MEKKIIVTEKKWEETSYWFETSDGKKLFLPWNWRIKVDLEEMIYIEEGDINYDLCVFPTLDELKQENKVVMKFPYTRYELNYNCFPSFFRNRNLNIKKVMAFFRKKGVNVTEEAILHNFNAWKCDMKSGYRDNENGYHLFTPCGCNRLSFRVTTLHEACKYQKTYTC